MNGCLHPDVVLDKRKDRGWDPPREQVRPRCTGCGWQGSWRWAE